LKTSELRKDAIAALFYVQKATKQRERNFFTTEPMGHYSLLSIQMVKEQDDGSRLYLNPSELF
jgi:hypothetical protein